MLRFATFLAPSMESVYAWIAEAVAARLDTTAELHVGRSYGEFADGRADLAFLCGLPYVHLADAPAPTVVPVAAPILEGERYGGRPIYFSDVIVPADSTYRTFEDLRGASWAFNEPDSQSGFGVVRAHLATLGETRSYFGRVVEAGFHDTAIRMVAEGKVDGAAIDSQVLSIALRDDAELTRRLRIVDVMGPSTIQPVVASTHLEPGLREAVRAALTGLADDPAARAPFARGLLRTFVPVADSDYEDIRRMEAAADASGLRGLGTNVESAEGAKFSAPNGRH
jgi:phosphonate transport system substrate-binding protein